MIEKLLGTEGYAVARLTNKVTGARIVLGAAHVFDAADGFALVTPDYLSASLAGQNSLHRITATLQADGEFDGPEWAGSLELYEPTAEQLLAVGYALEWYDDEIKARNLTTEGERLRLRAELASELSARAA